MVAAVALLVGVAACTDTVLEPKSTVTGANIFTDTGSYTQFLAKLYAGLGVSGQQGPAGQPDISGIDEGFSQYVRGLWQLQELPTDEAVIGWGDAGLPVLNTMQWSSDNPFISAFYYRIFYQISLVNEFLRETTEDKLVARGQEDFLNTVEQYRAEARFLRALSYWHGLDAFGSIPFVDENSGIGATPPEQATSQQIFDFIVSEVTEIRPRLPAAGAGEYGRADQAAASMLLAKVYLNAETYTGSAAWSQAMAEVEAVLNGGGYTLDDEYIEIFLADNHTSPEIIFPVPQDGRNIRTWGGTTFLQNAAVGGDMVASDYGIGGGWWGLRIQPEIVTLFPESGDARRDDIFFTQGQNLQISSLSEFRDGYAAPKYRNVTSTGQPGSDQTHSDVDFPIFRLGDAYLMYAELVLRGGGGSTDQAVQYVNALRERAYGDDSGNITADDLTLDFILDERARELYWEAHRRTDLIRFGVFTDGVWSWKGGSQAGSSMPAHLALFPLPAPELLANPNLTQNPGY
jgi:hypothetical protein